MLKNFYFTALRNLLKHKSYFMINISGLAIGIACCTFIAFYVINELSYDRFHSQVDHIYRVSNHAVIRGEENRDATTSAPMVETMKENYPEVLATARFLRQGSILIGNGSRKINEQGVLFADPGIFEVFDFKLISGNPEEALKHPRSMVLTEEAAHKYFGAEDPIGKKLTVEEDSIFYSVTGIIEAPPANSHIQFEMLASLSSTAYDKSSRWIGHALHGYVLLNQDADPAQLERKTKNIFYQYMAPTIEYFTGLSIGEWEAVGNQVDFKLIPIKDIHLHSESSGELEPTGNITYIYIYILIGIAILFIAIFNFVNLATAHSATRAKEVGVRKVIGSTKFSLIYQFVFESILVSVIATGLALVFIYSFQEIFIDLIGKPLALGVSADLWIIPIALVVAIGIGCLAGFYPAFVLSAFRPVEVLKGNLSSGSKTGWLRNLLVTTQFSASIVIIIGTMVIYSQIDYMLGKNLGFDKDQILVLEKTGLAG